MKARTLAVALAAAMSFTVVPTVMAAENHAAHEHRAEGRLRLALNEGRKWDTDEKLRQSMGDIRDVLAAQRSSVFGRSITAAEYRVLAAKIEAKLGYIVANCKLDPAADANLHVVLGELSGAADALKKGPADKSAEGLDRAVLAVNEYGKHFDHPGWKAL